VHVETRGLHSSTYSQVFQKGKPVENCFNAIHCSQILLSIDPCAPTAWRGAIVEMNRVAEYERGRAIEVARLVGGTSGLHSSTSLPNMTDSKTRIQNTLDDTVSYICMSSVLTGCRLTQTRGCRIHWMTW